MITSIFSASSARAFNATAVLGEIDANNLGNCRGVIHHALSICAGRTKLRPYEKLFQVKVFASRCGEHRSCSQDSTCRAVRAPTRILENVCTTVFSRITLENSRAYRGQS
jgi:hypothetical protein